MSHLVQHYRVYLTTWDLWETWVDAASEEEAEAEARRLFTDEGESAFRHRDCGIEHVEVDDYAEESA